MIHRSTTVGQTSKRGGPLSALARFEAIRLILGYANIVDPVPATLVQYGQALTRQQVELGADADPEDELPVVDPVRGKASIVKRDLGLHVTCDIGRNTVSIHVEGRIYPGSGSGVAFVCLADDVVTSNYETPWGKGRFGRSINEPTPSAIVAAVAHLTIVGYDRADIRLMLHGHGIRVDVEKIWDIIGQRRHCKWADGEILLQTAWEKINPGDGPSQDALRAAALIAEARSGCQGRYSGMWLDRGPAGIVTPPEAWEADVRQTI